MNALMLAATLATGNLIPDQPVTAPNYWCTWGTQGQWKSWRDAHPLKAEAEKLEGAMRTRAGLDEEYLFGEPGVLKTGYEQVRGELWVVIDDGWDVPYKTANTWNDKSAFGSQVIDTDRFPSFTGTPVERLAKLNTRIKETGWRGLGLWIAANPTGKDLQKYDRKKWEPYFRERLRWSHQAGIGIWKVDWGIASQNIEFRQWLTEMGRKEAPNLVIETALPTGPFFNAKGTRDALPLLASGDLFRTYDVQLATPTTLSRCAILLGAPAPKPPALGLLNIESQYYLGAGLGCTFGAMGHPKFWKGMDEMVTRALRWQRLAPPWPVGDGVNVSTNLLRELKTPRESVKAAWWGHHAQKAKIVDAQGRLFQDAPAVVTRGLPLEAITVEPAGITPYVVASRHPNGALAVAVLPRANEAETAKTSSASIRLVAGKADAPIGVFGAVNDLTLELDAPLGARKVLAQDLAGKEAVDITGDVKADGKSVVIPAGKLRAVSPGSLGLVLVVR